MKLVEIITVLHKFTATIAGSTNLNVVSRHLQSYRYDVSRHPPGKGRSLDNLPFFTS